MGYESTREGEKEVRVLVCVRACVRARTREGEFWGRRVEKEKEKRKPIETTYVAMTTVYYTYYSSRNDYWIIER